MLSTYLHAGTFAPYTTLLTRLIGNTLMIDMLRGKVGEHLRRHAAQDQVDKNCEEWSLLRRLLPEALDPIVRSELSYLDALPDRARST